MRIKRYICTSIAALSMATALATAPNTTPLSTEDRPVLPASDSKNPKFFSLKYDQGQSLKTNDYLKKDGMELGYRAVSAKFGFGQPGDSYEYLDGHKGYDGIGVYVANFDNEAYGTPFSVFVMHGGDIVEFNQRLHLQYEWNLGYSFNWGHYDPIDQPENITMGASESFHVGANLFLQWQPLRNMDIRVGGGLTHFSNGASRLPNKGMNLISPMVELRYRMDDPSYTFGNQSSREVRDIYGIHKPEDKDKHMKHELTLTVSKRQRYVSTIGTGMPTEFFDHSFRVFGLAYAPMRCPSRKFAYGVSLDMVYDESNNADVRKVKSETDGQIYDHVQLADGWERVQAGLSAKGEINMHYFSYFANLGYDMIHSDDETSRFYQIMGIQVHPTKKLFATMGIRAIKFSKAQFVYWSVGYVIEGKRKEKQENGEKDIILSESKGK